MALFSSKRSDNQALSHFLSNSPWLYRNLSRSVRTKAIEIIGTNGAIILDESGMKKSGDSSVGVSRQYCGNLGKVENCQVSVFLAYSKGTVLHQLDQKIIHLHYDFKHLTEKYFEIGMKLNDFSIQLVKYCIRGYIRNKGYTSVFKFSQ